MPQPPHVQNQPTASGDDGRWALLDLLTTARCAMHLSVADILVLRALLTFLPKGDFHPASAAMVVFPSNLTLAARCGGMEERTLRRHLARLEKLGLIARKHSPNKKRFACRSHAGQIIAAYGIDLRPLLAALPQIENHVATTRQDTATARFLRVRIRDCLYQLTVANPGQPHLIAPEDAQLLRNMLRRKPDITALRNVLQRLETLLNAVDNHHTNPLPTQELTGTDGQTVRHIQSSNKDSEESEPPVTDKITMLANAPDIGPSSDSPRTKHTDRVKKNPTADETLSLNRCQNALKEGLSFATTAVKTWADLVDLSLKLAPMIGIPRDVIDSAVRIMGTVKASLVVLAIIEMRERVKTPGAYLRAICDRAGRHEFSINRMIRAIEARRDTRTFPAGNTATRLG